MSRQGSSGFEYVAISNCIVCDRPHSDSARRFEKHFAWGRAAFVQCESCGSWCQSPQITPGSLKEWFDSADYRGSESQNGAAYANYLEDEAGRRSEALVRFRRDLRRHLAEGSRVLELGCSTGSLLSVIRDHGCETVGVDLSEKFVEAAMRMYGIEVLHGELADFDLPPRSFDLIVLFGTIGNLRDLNGYIRRFRRLLKESGRLIFNFADADSPVVKYVYGRNFWMFTPSVSCFMTQRGCEQTLTRNGFRIVSMRRDRQRPSLQKLFHHARAGFLIPFARRLGINGMCLPLSLPIPSVRFVDAVLDVRAS